MDCYNFKKHLVTVLHDNPLSSMSKAYAGLAMIKVLTSSSVVIRIHSFQRTFWKREEDMQKIWSLWRSCDEYCVRHCHVAVALNQPQLQSLSVFYFDLR
ncbi:hypothetical protein PanWU01x14_299020 [Parasponia andersonii]|uniref:Uncharacterized protein n=1 Tax=Parasponia andersonii TaxID=3476 RepID=A0A2P5AUI7_PARAD|nr:hypothetical protein PanWU01x14_299020 [Parasponia andersonii]